MQDQQPAPLRDEEPNQGGGAWAIAGLPAGEAIPAPRRPESGADARREQAPSSESGGTNSDPGPLPQVERGELELQYAAGTVPEGERYTVADGDSLQTIAARFFGSALEWERIYEANNDRLGNPDHLYPGQELVIPAADRVDRP